MNKIKVLEVFMHERKVGTICGLYGAFADSLPDGWGRLLVDRTLLRGRENPEEIDNMNRLAIVGASGMGALTYVPVILVSRGLTALDREAE